MVTKSFQLDELNPDNTVACFIRELMDKYLIQFPQEESSMWYSALLVITANDEQKAMHYAEYQCDILANGDRCDWAKTDSDWLKETLEREDGSKTNICRASEFKRVVDLYELTYLSGEDAFIDADFTEDMDDTEVKRKSIQSSVDTYKSRGEDPYLVMVAVHRSPISE